MKTLIFLALLVANIGHSQELKISPVYGFERTYHAEPKPSRYRTEIFLGIRANYGTELFSLEAEINQANSDDDVGNIKAKYNTQTLMLGLKLVPISAEYYNIFLRAGVRARKKTTELTQNGVTTTSTDGPNLDPYAGTGIGINVGSIISLNVSATLVYNRNAPEGEQYDTRYTLGAGLKFGNR